MAVAIDEIVLNEPQRDFRPLGVARFGGLIATGFGSSQDGWQSETTETTETTVTGFGGDFWVTFGLFQERLCDVSVVVVVSVVSIWHWIRSVVCQLSELRAAEP